MYIEDFSSQSTDDIPKIRVIIRKRPLSQKELKKNDVDIIDMRGAQTVVVRETKTKVDLTKYIEEHNFNFDRAYGEHTTNDQLYEETVRPLVESLFQRTKVTCFAYGQTGSGKTFTMMGELKAEDRQRAMPGLYLLAARDIFHLLDQSVFQHLGIYVSFYEIYCGKLHDLLNGRQQLFAREDAKQNVNIVGLTEKKVLNVNSLMQIIDFGNSMRTTSQTAANQDSSRSHAVLQIALKDGKKPYGKMSFIDLAGSERGAVVSDTNKQTRMDGAEINKSLLALKECIRALDQDKKHTPFRGSKLTLVLKDSFTGNCKTVMIGNISPALTSCEHTLNTLRYADRVKELKKPSGDEGGQKSQSDLLARQLMLPRQTKNSTRISIGTEEDEEEQMNYSGTNTNINNSMYSNEQNKRYSEPTANNNSKVQTRKQQGNANNHQGMMNQNYPNQTRQQQQQQQQQFEQNMMNQHASIQTRHHQQVEQNMMNHHASIQTRHHQQAEQNMMNQHAPIQTRHQQAAVNTQQNPPQTSSLLAKEQRMSQTYQNSENSHNNSYSSHSTLVGDLLNNLRNTFQPETTTAVNNPPRNSLSNQTGQNNSPNDYMQNTSNSHPIEAYNKENLCPPKNQNQNPLRNQNLPLKVSSCTTKLGPSTSRDTAPVYKNTVVSRSTREKTEPNADIYIKLEDGGPKGPANSSKLVNLVMMEEQEEMAIVHGQYIEAMNELVKRETNILKDLANPLVDPKKYVEKLEHTLAQKVELMSILRQSLGKFKDKLREEEEFNNKFINIFDTSKRDNFNEGEIQLLDDLL